MTWNHFIFFAIASVLLWAAGALAAWKGKNRTAVAATVAGAGWLGLSIAWYRRARRRKKARQKAT